MQPNNKGLRLALRSFGSFFLGCIPLIIVAQNTGIIRGKIISDGKPVEYAQVILKGTTHQTQTDSTGYFQIMNISTGSYTLKVVCVGYMAVEKLVSISPPDNILEEIITLKPTAQEIDEVVVSGTLKEVNILDSPVPVSVYTSGFFLKNPTPNLFDALQLVQGVRPQINCSICNTGDIHINGLEGPYTLVLIDGMPIVSGLGTVYGLMGIPNSMIERIEIVKGPVATLYGSESIGGLINIITKKPKENKAFALDVMTTSWFENTIDVGIQTPVTDKVRMLLGINYFNFKKIQDFNKDGFTDMALQDRFSIFKKWHLERKNQRVFTMAARYLYEDRWGGQTNWEKLWRGSDSIYGESIYTHRFEWISTYQLPMREHVFLQTSFNVHRQNAAYGTMPYSGDQRIAFAQLYWDKKIGKQDLLGGVSLRYTYYDDNTPATRIGGTSGFVNHPQKTLLPGIFLQDALTLHPNHVLMIGIRLDYHSVHGVIHTPRIAYKWNLGHTQSLRFHFGTGFRVVSIFTEDHAALTGARVVEMEENLKPEQSYNITIQYNKDILVGSYHLWRFNISSFYTYFTNRILPEYDTDPNKIIYANLEGFAQSRGISLQSDWMFYSKLKILLGATIMKNTITEQGITRRQVLTENVSSTWTVSYTFPRNTFTFDYTGNLYGPMLLPLAGPYDPRPSSSPWWSIQNIQISQNIGGKWEWYAGVKNLLDWTPARSVPFLIARSHDPFDRNVEYDANGNVMRTPENPYGLTFDPTYTYAPNQGRRLFVGVRIRY